jgi:hypothetical protein
MENADYTGLLPAVTEKIAPMIGDIVAAAAANIHSFHVVGSAVISDFDEKLSDINSVVVLRNMDLQFIRFLAPLGKKYGKKRIAAPLVMTPEYIRESLDAFPIEFLDFKLIHKTVYGEDLLRELPISVTHLRLQCEREIKSRLIHARQGYLSSLGRKEGLSSVLVRSITGSMALFRSIISLFGAEPPVARLDVISAFGQAAKTDTGIFRELLALKAGLVKPSEQELNILFERYYNALEAVGKIVNDLHA